MKETKESTGPGHCMEASGKYDAGPERKSRFMEKISALFSSLLLFLIIALLLVMVAAGIKLGYFLMTMNSAGVYEKECRVETVAGTHLPHLDMRINS